MAPSTLHTNMHAGLIWPNRPFGLGCDKGPSLIVHLIRNILAQLVRMGGVVVGHPIATQVRVLSSSSLGAYLLRNENLVPPRLDLFLIVHLT